MKRCIVCKAFHDRGDLFCDDHADLTNSEKLQWYKKYNFILENSSTIMDLDEYSLIIAIPKRNAVGVLDETKSKIIINGKELKINPPLYLKIDENMDIDMKLNF